MMKGNKSSNLKKRDLHFLCVCSFHVNFKLIRVKFNYKVRTISLGMYIVNIVRIYKLDG